MKFPSKKSVYNTMLDKLKEETKSAHQNVEKVLIQELKALSSKQDYANLLNRLYHFYVSVEKQLHDIIDTNTIPDIEKRKHVHRIVQDIKSIDYSIQNQGNFQAPLNIPSLSHALGTLYVIEGSTLGGQIISKMLQKQLNLKDDSAISYFKSYGDKTALMWQDFKIYISALEEHINENDMIAGAKNTFKSLENWLSHFKL